MSPEYRKYIKINYKFNYEQSDIFSLGITILRLD